MFMSSLLAVGKLLSAIPRRVVSSIFGDILEKWCQANNQRNGSVVERQSKIANGKALSLDSDDVVWDSGASPTNDLANVARISASKSKQLLSAKKTSDESSNQEPKIQKAEAQDGVGTIRPLGAGLPSLGAMKLEDVNSGGKSGTTALEAHPLDSIAKVTNTLPLGEKGGIKADKESDVAPPSTFLSMSPLEFRTALAAELAAIEGETNGRAKEAGTDAPRRAPTEDRRQAEADVEVANHNEKECGGGLRGPNEKERGKEGARRPGVRPGLAEVVEDDGRSEEAAKKMEEEECSEAPTAGITKGIDGVANLEHDDRGKIPREVKEAKERGSEASDGAKSSVEEGASTASSAEAKQASSCNNARTADDPTDVPVPSDAPKDGCLSSTVATEPQSELANLTDVGASSTMGGGVRIGQSTGVPKLFAEASFKEDAPKGAAPGVSVTTAAPKVPPVEKAAFLPPAEAITLSFVSSGGYAAQGTSARTEKATKDVNKSLKEFSGVREQMLKKKASPSVSSGNGAKISSPPPLSLSIGGSSGSVGCDVKMTLKGPGSGPRPTGFNAMNSQPSMATKPQIRGRESPSVVATGLGSVNFRTSGENKLAKGEGGRCQRKKAEDCGGKHDNTIKISNLETLSYDNSKKDASRNNDYEDVISISSSSSNHSSSSSEVEDVTEMMMEKRRKKVQEMKANAEVIDDSNDSEECKDSVDSEYSSDLDSEGSGDSDGFVTDPPGDSEPAGSKRKREITTSQFTAKRRRKNKPGCPFEVVIDDKDLPARPGAKIVGEDIDGAPGDGEIDRSIKQRIIKLLNTGFHEESNEHEAQIAMKLARRLIERHNLDAALLLQERGDGSLNDFSTSQNSDGAALQGGMVTVRIHDKKRGRPMYSLPRWIDYLAKPVCLNFRVKGYLTHRRGTSAREGRCSVTFYGVEANAQLAAYAFKIASERIALMAATYDPPRQESLTRAEQGGETRRARLSYALGVVNGLKKEVEDGLQKDEERRKANLMRAQRAATTGEAYQEDCYDDDYGTGGGEQPCHIHEKLGKMVEDIAHQNIDNGANCLSAGQLVDKLERENVAHLALIDHREKIALDVLKSRNIKLFPGRKRKSIALNLPAYRKGEIDSKEIDLNRQAIEG
ncbi:hypothetical protein ACHAWF_009671 [Thalassiosira exigua]